MRGDRTGLNEHHSHVQRRYAAIDRVLNPIVAAEERRAGAHLLKPGRAVRVRDEVDLRQLDDALRTASTRLGQWASVAASKPAVRAPLTEEAVPPRDGDGDDPTTTWVAAQNA